MQEAFTFQALAYWKANHDIFLIDCLFTSVWRCVDNGNLCMWLRVSRWIEAMESLPSLLVPGLVYIVDSTDHKG